MQKLFLILAVLLATGVAMAGIYNDIDWLKWSGELLLLSLLFFFYRKKLPSRKFNFLAFSGCLLLAVFSSYWKEVWVFDYLVLGLWLAAYIFLAREAFTNTEYVRGSKITNVYFVLVVLVYAYLLLLHISEMEQSMGSKVDLVLYIIYYVNILIFAATGLVYYLNSFSKKSVYFICLALSFVFADILRDMELFYLPDLSVKIVSLLIQFAAIKLAFLFFVTPEKKLRLLHLVSEK